MVRTIFAPGPNVPLSPHPVNLLTEQQWRMYPIGRRMTIKTGDTQQKSLYPSFNICPNILLIISCIHYILYVSSGFLVAYVLGKKVDRFITRLTQQLFLRTRCVKRIGSLFLLLSGRAVAFSHDLTSTFNNSLCQNTWIWTSRAAGPEVWKNRFGC